MPQQKDHAGQSARLHEDVHACSNRTIAQSIMTCKKEDREVLTLLPIQLRQEGPTSQLLGGAELAVVLAVDASESPASRAVQLRWSTGSQPDHNLH